MFNLEREIEKWKKSLRKNASLEDGYIEELESHLRDKIESEVSGGSEEAIAFEKAKTSLGRITDVGIEFQKTDAASSLLNDGGKVSPFSPVLMITYLKVIIRYLKKYKSYSMLNIAGLTIGIACCLFIMLYINFELSYDTYHNNSERIYRVSKINENTERLAANVIEVAPTLLANYPEVEAAGIAGTRGEPIVSYEDKKYVEDRVKLANSGIFNILNIEFLQGDKSTALTRKLTAVITERISKKYFGNENPIGKKLLIDTTYYEVTHVVANCPPNTHLKYDTFLHLDPDNMGPWQRPWAGWHAMNYIKLTEGVDPQKFEKKIANLPDQYLSEEFKKRGMGFTLFLQPIESIHLYSNLKWEAEAPGNVIYLYVFGIIGLLILLNAGFNFINLSTARSGIRLLEVGIRKVMGASKPQLITQFLIESLTITFVSIMLALLLVIFLMPWFNEIAGVNSQLVDLINPSLLTGLGLVFIIIGIAAGIYPAFVLSSGRALLLTQKLFYKSENRYLLRRVLVVGQFSISILLIIGTLVLNEQLDFMKNEYPGFDKDQKLVLELNRERVNSETFESVKHEFERHPSIIKSAFSSSVPGRWMYLWRMYPYGEEKTNTHATNCFQVDKDFLNLYDIQLAAGNQFLSSENNRGCLLNEVAVKTFGWSDFDEALTHQINRQSNQIIGIMKDFHFRGLQSNIEPLIIFLMNEDYRYLTLKVELNNLEETVSFVKNKYVELFPEDIFNYFFLDEDFNRQYASDEQLAESFNIFTILGIIIACLGLTGLASFMAERKTKEIGIRKTLGASSSQILVLFTGQFIWWVLLSNVIAWPIAYFAIQEWLKDFAYKTEIDISLFIFSAIAALLIALGTISFQTLKAARANPVEALKYE